MAAVDIALAIAGFLEDASSTSLELPHLTTGERKHTKMLLESHPQLRCESFGFGQERQLHLFKKEAVEPQKWDASNDLEDSQDHAPFAVNVKNTFIDDWIEPKPEPVMFRSLPAKPDRNGLEFASMMRCSQDEVDNADSGEKGQACIKQANSGHVAELASREEVQVRNTFIHFEKVVSDDRAVQSMPHGMFKRHILADALHAKIGSNTPTTTGYDTPSTASEADLELANGLLDEVQGAWGHQGRQSLSAGALVVVEGLVKLPAFNGRSAVVEGWDAESGRYNILLASPDGCHTAKIKEENLRVVLPCP